MVFATQQGRFPAAAIPTLSTAEAAEGSTSRLCCCPNHQGPTRHLQKIIGHMLKFGIERVSTQSLLANKGSLHGPSPMPTTAYPSVLQHGANPLIHRRWRRVSCVAVAGFSGDLQACCAPLSHEAFGWRIPGRALKPLPHCNMFCS